MSKSIKSVATVVPFDAFASAIVKATTTADRANEKMRDAIVVSMQQYVDVCFQSNGRTEHSCKALQAGIKDSETANNAVAMGLMEAKTFTEYAQSAARALHWNIPFLPSLKNNTELALPWSKKSTGANPKSGKVETTNDKALIETLVKARTQAKLVNRLEVAGMILDAILEIDADYKETM